MHGVKLMVRFVRARCVLIRGLRVRWCWVCGLRPQRGMMAQKEDDTIRGMLVFVDDVSSLSYRGVASDVGCRKMRPLHRGDVLELALG
jgi:hypothetical protein